MTDDQLLRLLTDADPMPDRRAAELPLSAATDDLLTALTSRDPPSVRQDDDGRVSAPVERSRRRLPRGRGRRVALVAAVAVTVAVVLAALPDRGRRGGGPATAYGADAVRFAEASPLVLLKADGWRVEYADESSAREGELHFRTGPTPPPQAVQNGAATATPVPADLTSAELNWRAGPLGSWLKDRADGAAATATAQVLGTTAHVYQYAGGTPGHRDITALLRYDGRVLEFRAGAAGIPAFKALLATLTPVGTDTWLAAMPPSVVKPSDRGDVIAEMLKGVPVPPGFDRSDIKGADLTKDRYQLGAAVTGLVACRWLQRWSAARRAGDSAAVERAVAAMATAKDWPILKEMTKEGAYPDVLWQYADAMRSGQVKGGSLEEGADSALGCDGVQIGPGPGPR